jgi:hypothetical protein
MTKKVVHVAALLLLSGCAREANEASLEIHDFSKGTVKAVDSCDRSKYSLNCVVETTAWTKRIDVTDYPGEYVAVGDVLWWRNYKYSNRRSQSVCRNDWCTSMSVCYSWMPCYE